MITAELARRGIDFGRWPVIASPTISDTELIECYSDYFPELNADGRYRHIDVARMTADPADPQWPSRAAAARETFRSEHRHAEDEVRFFVAGQGCFYLHIGTEVAAVVCAGGDVVSVPAGTRHWFDMGARPDFVAIRFFERQDGWVGQFTGDPIGERFPGLEELLEAPC
ncbi:cupin [Mycolicibacter heraklionensis]|nr:cupin [Mycolicibacter heraklionensis]